MAERDFVARGHVPDRPSFLPRTHIEFLNLVRRPVRPQHVLFDFDGTLSLIREGWMDIMVPMMRDILLNFARPGETEKSIEALVREYVTRLTGKQTIYQMIHLTEEIKARGGEPEEPLAYKERYHSLLMERIASRRKGLADGSLDPADFLVPGSTRLLEALTARGALLYIASGTDEAYVLEEAHLLGLDRWAQGRIYGAVADHRAFSKEMVIRRIRDENKVEGPKLLAFGDGYVEISDAKAAGGFAVGVASDETGRSGRPDEWKRRRLIGAGADLIVPDYAEAETLVAYVWGEANEP
jgi:phosphoglycolate phosphatase-like HAD superfamily hydrolase